MSSDQEEEFVTTARWTTEAIRVLGQDHAVPAACQGSGSPSAIRWLCAALRVRRGQLLVDCGGGLGGPATLAATEFGAMPLVVEPSPEVCRSAATLFSLRTVAAEASSLPLPTDSVHTMWSLGVLCTLSDQHSSLSEMRRVLAPGARLGMLVYLRSTAEEPARLPENHFPTEAELADLLSQVGLRQVERRRLDAFDDPDHLWQERERQVSEEVRRRHHDDAEWQRAEATREEIGRLIRRDLLRGEVLLCRPET